MKFVATVATVLIAAAGVITFEACNKKETTTVEPTIIKNNRNPIANYDNNNGTMMYSFDLEKINKEFNEKVSKTNQDRYIVESIEILDEDPTDVETCPEIKIVVVDTEEETSTTTWFMDTFASKSVNSGNTIYFLDSEVDSGTYQFATSNNDGTFNVYSVVNGTIDSVSNELPCNSSWRPKWTISCTASNCTYCTKVKIGPHEWSCTQDCPPGGTCTSGNSVLVNIIVVVTPIIIGALI